MLSNLLPRALAPRPKPTTRPRTCIKDRRLTHKKSKHSEQLKCSVTILCLHLQKNQPCNTSASYTGRTSQQTQPVKTKNSLMTATNQPLLPQKSNKHGRARP